jgi:signal transduction histidine kinase
MAGREASARRALEKTNAELEATRESLARTSRDAERLRIARELHDLLGHDLVALHLELETARHVADGKARGPVERAHAVTKTLLADLRKAVTHLRDDAGHVDAAVAVRDVVCKVLEPRIELVAPASLELEPVLSNTIVRCVQEIVTNTIKHAAAENLRIELVSRDGRIELATRDDGRGARGLSNGAGLQGMRERVEKLGGELTIETAEGAGFRVRAAIPVGPAKTDATSEGSS